MNKPDEVLDDFLNVTLSEDTKHRGQHTKHFRQYDVLKTDTYQMVELKTALNSRKLRPYLKKIGLPESGFSMDSINYYITGKRPLINIYVFMTRTAVQPSRWYLKTSEPLPERISFTPKFTESLLREKETLGHEKLKGLVKLYSIAGLAKMYGFTENDIKNVLYKRKEPETGKMIFKTIPSAALITAFRAVINPDYWFIFPEEIEDSDGENQMSDFLVNQVCNLISEKYNVTRDVAFNMITKTQTYQIIKKEISFNLNMSEVLVLSKQVLEMWENEKIIGDPKNSKYYRENYS